MSPFSLVRFFPPRSPQHHGVLEAVRRVADQLQRAAAEPSSDRGRRAGVRPGPDPAGRSAAVPAAQQPETSHHQLEGDQPAAPDVTGTRRSKLRKQESEFEVGCAET